MRRSTVDLRSCSFSLELAGKLLRYMDRSMRSELCSWSSNLTNFSFCLGEGEGEGSVWGWGKVDERASHGGYGLYIK